MNNQILLKRSIKNNIKRFFSQTKPTSPHTQSTAVWKHNRKYLRTMMIMGSLGSTLLLSGLIYTLGTFLGPIIGWGGYVGFGLVLFLLNAGFGIFGMHFITGVILPALRNESEPLTFVTFMKKYGIMLPLLLVTLMPISFVSIPLTLLAMAQVSVAVPAVGIAAWIATWVITSVGASACALKVSHWLSISLQRRLQKGKIPRWLARIAGRTESLSKSRDIPMIQ